jgi:hypothetical protein
MYKFRDGSSYSKEYYMICGNTLIRRYDCRVIRTLDDLI